ncbi:MaoC family dehydratase [Pantoea sp. 18069]|uniref:MaoC family dehydratase n=1 Tax=Pantoea sp. 18069 TaxID=2681415 RepID=UPI00135C6B9C|nr:MaoC family dehydratase [Pantoea sp. 18069]
MRILQTPQDFLGIVGQTLGTSGWFTITQAHISDFARVTGDDFWIHVDTERAAREMPAGKTIAHGIYMLSLVPLLQRDIFRIERRGRGLNYGSNKVRYTAPVPVGSRVRLHQTLAGAERAGQATRIVTRCEFEIEGGERPALVAEFILHLEDAPA